MAMIPIPSATLLGAITRIRAGEGLYTVAHSLHIDPERLSRQLRATFADFDGLMRAHSGHKPRRLRITRSPKRVKCSVKGGGFHDVRFEERMKPERAQAFAEARARGMRITADFSAVEIEEIRVKVAGWYARGEGRPCYRPRTLEDL